MEDENVIQDRLFEELPPDRMFYKIRDVAKILDVKTHVLRYWETEFPTLNPQKNKNGQRVYTKKDVEMAMEIKRLLHVEKYSIAGAKRLLKKKKGGGKETASLALDAMKSVREELSGLLATLQVEI
ncbi:MAG: MerR family transcriptional regulator [Nitrospinae bacterium]|nr:MerR family transcriptional regulator [Nitrospinota bacterium]MBF0634218.1 MerR family transcriptional regulator [Nitrospinota bacterium]